jgi:hypothetical protein
MFKVLLNAAEESGGTENYGHAEIIQDICQVISEVTN